MAIAAVLTLAPASAGDLVIQDNAGRTLYVIREYPTGNQLVVQMPDGRTAYVIQDNGYGGRLITDPAGNTVGRIEPDPWSYVSTRDSCFGYDD